MLLTNWLNTLTSRIRKRRVFRSRDRRDIRKRWQSIVHNQISTTEALEDRTLLTTFFVDDDFDGSTPDFGDTHFDTIQAAVTAAASSGDLSDIIHIADGTYNENVTVGTSIEFIGAGTAATTVTGSGNLFTVTADDVSFQDMKLEGATQGIRVDLLGGTVDNLQVDNVHFIDIGSYGIEVHNGTTLTNLDVANSLFRGTASVGIRFAQSAIGDGVDIDNTEFDGLGRAIYQQSQSATGLGYLADLQLTDSTIHNMSSEGIYVEELTGDNITGTNISNNIFEDNSRDIILNNKFGTSGTAFGNIFITGNTFTDSEKLSIQLNSKGTSLEAGVTISGNTFNTAIESLIQNWGQIDVSLQSGFSHAPVVINENTINFTGSSSGATEAYGIRLMGASDDITINGNTLTDTNTGGVQTSALFVDTNNADMGPISSTAIINATNNFISGFDSAVSVLATSGPMSGPGGLVPGAQLNINNNSITNNAIGVLNGPGATVNASGNWWGSFDEDDVAALMTVGVDFSSYLNSGTDTDGGTAGFQGDFSVVNVTALGAQTGPVGRIQEAIDLATSGATINIAAGTYNENVNVNKSVTLDGAGTAATFVDNTGNLFLVTANDVRFQDMTLQNGSQAIRVELAAGTVDNLQVDNVHIVNFSSNGFEIHNATTVTNMSVTNSLIQNTGNGFRLSSSAVGDGIDIDNTIFDTNNLGFYQANDGSTGNVRDLQITNSTFRNSSGTAVFAEEIRDSAIDGNIFEDNRRDFTLFKAYTGAGTVVENLQIINNTMTDSEESAIIIYVFGSGLAGTIDINGNTINSDVGVMTSDWAKIDVRLQSGFSHAPININENEITFSGTYGAGATTVHGIKVRGASDSINIERNTLDGGSVGSIGGTPQTSGVFIQTNDATMGLVDASAVINVLNNSITGFDAAVSVYDPVGLAFGGLTSGAQLNVNNNSLEGNSAGVVSDAGELVNASNNWWGPGTEATIHSLMAGGVDFTSYLADGTDTDIVTAGFQGDFSVLNVTALGAQTGPLSRIQEAVEAVNPGGTINIASGTYAGNVDATATGIDKNVRLAPGSSPGQVVIDGDLKLDGNDIVDIEVNGTIAGTEYDQFIVNGDLALGGAMLNLIDGHTPDVAESYILIKNDGPNPVTGTFNGYPEGHEFTDFLGVGGLSAFLTYSGGDGNDVAIYTEVPNPVVTIPNDGAADEYTLQIIGSNVVITEVGSGNVISTYHLAALEGPLVINGEAGVDDQLTIDMTGIDETTDLQIIFNGGAGGHDTLELVNGNLNSMEFRYVDPSTGSIRLNGSGSDFISYTGLEPVTSTVNVTNVTLTFTGGAEIINISDLGGGQTRVNSSLGEMTDFLNPTGTLTINAGTGADTININSLAAGYTADIIINGDDETDTINVNSSVSLAAGKTIQFNAEVVELTGDVTADAITGTAATVNITGSAGGAEIQDAIDLAASGATINVAAGTYAENITLSKQVDLLGAQSGVDARGRGGTLDDALSSIIAPAAGTALDLQSGSAGTTIDGFTFSGGTTGIVSTSGSIDDLQILNNQFVGFTGSGVFLNNSGDDITVHQNVIDGTSQAGGGGIFHLDQDTFDGFHFTSNWVLNGDTGFFVDGTRNVSSSANRDPLFEDNLFDGNGAGANFGRFGVENAVVQNNVFSNN
ncbi:beta strand repeat-containing protein, partial [Gimesia maris]|uniref:beta strand repeat-containing protein n=1 Tax=Gimesia maris TaxID=122 RepID=UPI003A91053B